MSSEEQPCSKFEATLKVERHRGNVSDVPARLRLKALAWARLSLAWAHRNFKPSPSRQKGLGSGRLGLEPRLLVVVEILERYTCWAI